MGVQFYVFKSVQHRYAKVHRGSCAYCKHGQGANPGGNDPAIDMWQGPFNTLPQAQQVARNTGYEDLAHCQKCCGDQGRDIPEAP